MKETVVALSGTLETFSLPDVLRLLSSTKKTGLLALDGDRGRGRIWVRDGAIVAADADRAAHEQVEGVAFELLRFADAGFEFHSGDEPAADGDARAVDDVLAEAEARLAEWREIEAVVPSLDVWVRMVADIDGTRPVTPEQWRVLAQVGTGASGHGLSERLGQGEYDVCRQLRDLIADRMVVLDEAPAEAVAPTHHFDVDSSPDSGFETEADVESAWSTEPEEPTFVEPALDPEAVSSLGADLASFVAVGTVDEVASETPDETHETHEPHQTDDDDDFLSQLSQLSPKAAAAVEATWSGDAPQEVVEHERATDEAPAPDVAPGADGEEIDQNLLLRFLSSTTKQ